MAGDDKERARQLRAEARRRRRDEALRRYRERTVSSDPSPEAAARRRPAAVEADGAAEHSVSPDGADGSSASTGLRRREQEEPARAESQRKAVERESAECQGRETAEREAAEREARAATKREERARRPPLTAAEIAGSGAAADTEGSSTDHAEPEPEPAMDEALTEEEPPTDDVGEPTASMTEGLPSAPRDIVARDVAADGTVDVPAPTSPRRSMGVRGFRALGTLAVALGSIASLLLALGALTLALGERPAALFDALEPICRTLAFGTGDDAAAVDLLVTWIIAGLAYLVIGFAVQSFSRRVTRRRSRG
ncbi:hypothetical protein [Aeromicrobium sp. PE09-221]|uniref:hypothetical protein n=1 Tax=Aeromicrobium sp. PE09-221 TaxID=1898043 RepID=UPI001124441D|nr:hypothetical protein [Aeromicrobium sp. PE09-221]